MKKFAVLTVLAASIFTLAACSSEASTPANNEPAVQVQAEEESKEPEEITEAEEEISATVVISHEYGDTEVPTNPEKVLTLDFASLDILDSIGIEIGGLPKGSLPNYLDKFSSDDYLNMGSLKEADFEAIYEYAPDVIFMSGRLASSYDELSEIAPTIYMPMPGATYFETLIENIDTLAKIFPANAEELNAKVDGILQQITDIYEAASAEELTALVLLANDGSLSVYGEGSRYGIFYSDLGFIPADEEVVSSTHGQEGSFEYIQTVDPDILFVIDRSAAIGTEGATGAAALLDNDIVASTKAARNGKIIYLSSDIWYLASGGIVSTEMMLEEVAVIFE